MPSALTLLAMGSEEVAEFEYGTGDESDRIHLLSDTGVTTHRVDDHVEIQDDWGVVTPDGTYYGPGTSKEVGRALRGLSEAGAPHSAGQTQWLEQNHRIEKRLPLSELP